MVSYQEMTPRGDIFEVKKDLWTKRPCMKFYIGFKNHDNVMYKNLLVFLKISFGMMIHVNNVSASVSPDLNIFSKLTI